MTKCAVTLALFSGMAWGQALPPAPAFEVASVKRDLSGGKGGEIRAPRGGIFTATNSTLQGLIRYAYGVRDYQIEGPGWMDTERYDIKGQGAGERSNQETKAMLQDLLGTRFGLKIRHETRQLPVYALVAAKSGPKLRESKPADSTSIGSTNHSIVANKVTMDLLATALSGQMDRPVLNSTGVQGTFDVDLEWSPDAAPGDAALLTAPSLFAALQEQLGLRLEAQRGAVEVLVVEHAEKIPTEN